MWGRFYKCVEGSISVGRILVMERENWGSSGSGGVAVGVRLDMYMWWFRMIAK